MNLIQKTAKINSIFLAVILIAGTFAAVYPSFIIGIQAQSDEPYYEMDNRYNSYEQEREYENSNSYESDYEKDSSETSYQNDYYEEPREYPYYKEDYKQEYPQYGKDNNIYKSKDKERSSVSINKVNCVNNNVNINGNNTGDINLGNNGRTASSSGTDEGYLDIGSYEGNRGEGYYKQKGESFNCIINNNNVNNNFGAGNVTDGDGTEPKPTCGECFTRTLTLPLQNSINMFLNDEVQDIVLSPTLTIPGSIIGISDLCTFFNTVDPIPLTQAEITAFINMALQELPGVGAIPNAQAQLQALVLCLIEADIIVVV